MAVLKKNAYFSGPTTEGIEEIKTFFTTSLIIDGFIFKVPMPTCTLCCD